MVTLTFAQFPALATTDGSAVVNVSGGFPIVVVRTGATTATALSATCTHAACLVEYEASSHDIHCPCHDADFDLTGRVTSGPAPTPLPVYAATVSASAITVQLT